MASVLPSRMSAEIEGDFVVFLIGMRINRPWKISSWLPVARAMPAMLKELDEHPEAGCLGYTAGFPVTVQYWRSFEHLEAYARNADNRHWPAWVEFNRRFGRNRGEVGFWHETYRVRAGEYESVYSGMPPFGLGKAGTLVPATGSRSTARGRLDGIDADAEPDDRAA